MQQDTRGGRPAETGASCRVGGWSGQLGYGGPDSQDSQLPCARNAPCTVRPPLSPHLTRGGLATFVEYEVLSRVLMLQPREALSTTRWWGLQTPCESIQRRTGVVQREEKGRRIGETH